jgi:hypothetical protein
MRILPDPDAGSIPALGTNADLQTIALLLVGVGQLTEESVVLWKKVPRRHQTTVYRSRA